MTEHDDFRPGAGGVPSGDDRFLAGLRRAATGIEPDRHFADRLWADLSAPAPRLADPYGDAPTERPADPHGRTDRRPSRPAGRARRLAGRVASPLTTVAAALVIALVGYGALSLSGTAPGALFERDAPNASAEGQAMADHPIVGTWAIWTTEIYGTPTLIAIMTFNSDGGLIVQRGWEFVEGGEAGTWSSTADGSITFQSISLYPEEWLRENFAPGTTIFPRFIQLSGTGTRSADGSGWDLTENSGEMILIGQDGTVYRMPDDPEATADPLVMRAERIEDVVDRAGDLSPAQQRGLERQWIDPSGASPVASPSSSVIPGEGAPPTAASTQEVPTPTVAPTEAVPTPTPG